MDVDIDTPPSFKPARYFPEWVRASILKDEELSAHPCGVYPQNIAVDPVTGLSAVPYDRAEEFGYLKIDFLHLNVYQHFSSRAEIEEFASKEPDWGLLRLSSVQQKLFQLSRHGDLLNQLKINSIEDLADAMALIRPGKKQLLGLYQKDKLSARKALYAQDDSGYSFKRSHSFAYAYVVVLQLHLIECGRL
jgi:DNA polymerase III alpha subunit